MIVESGNHYIAALKGNQSGLLSEVKANFKSEQQYEQINRGHGRIEKRTVSICGTLDVIRDWQRLKTLIRVESERETRYQVSHETRYYISSLTADALEFYERIRGYWGVENKVHYPKDVTQKEDASRIRTVPLVQIYAQARNFALNLYRDNEFTNMAQAERRCSNGLKILKKVLRMK